MKIAILTLPLHNNIGGILQAWALQTVLDDMGHKARVLMPKNWKPNIPIYVRTKRQILKILGRLNEDNFKRKEINIHWIKSLSVNNISGYDAIVAGSDQIWRKELFCPMWQSSKVEDAFLAFSSNSKIRRLSYAASLGVEHWEYDHKETECICRSLGSLDAISVRECSTVDIIKEATGYTPEFVLDPTMLISAGRYIELVKKELPSTHGGLISYILDMTPEKKDLIERVVHSKGLSHTEINNRSISVKKWIANMAMADMIVTDSFHGCVFAIIFNKPLVFVLNKERGNARFDSLIKTFNLENNLVKFIDDFNSNCSYSLPSNIYVRIELLQKKSRDFLVLALQK